MQRFNRAEAIDRQFVTTVAQYAAPVPEPIDPRMPVRADCALTGTDLVELLESQIVSRHLDLIARKLRAEEKSYYTIGSSGHEGNAVLGRLTRHTDPAFLHYRSGAFMAERARKLPDQDVIRDTVLSQVASADDPISGGRHKVWGSKALWVLPQTSTIASHLPKSVGAALAISRAKRLRIPLPIPEDSIVVCTFGDASTNHAVAQTAFNAACYAFYSGQAIPILFVCEDNGIGISVHTTPGWVQHNYSRRARLKYIAGNGLDVVDAFRTASEAIEHCRLHRAPVFLHLQTVRLLGHAGTDFELEYHTMAEIEAAEAMDPVLATARTAIECGVLRPGEIAARYEAVRLSVAAAAENALKRPKLTSASQIIAPLAPYHADAVSAEASRAPERERRVQFFGGEAQLPEQSPPRHLAVQINRALTDLMIKYDDMLIFGEDVAHKGGVYYVTKGLLKQFGPARVFNTLLDETTILGIAQGFGSMGMLPVPELQYLAYFHNAEDQIRGEACSLQYFSTDQYRNPMVVRIASFGYQKGFGGHFHNDNSVAALRDIPGLIVAAPSRGDDAAGMLRTALALAKADGRVVAYLEPIALYMTRDLYEPDDGLWQTAYPSADWFVPLGQPRVYDEAATDLTIISYANGVPLSLRAARTMLNEDRIRARVVDLRWLNPLNHEAIAAHGSACGRVLVVDECRRTGGVAEGVFTSLVENCDPVPRMARVTGLDTYTPLGPAARLVLPSESQIVESARLLCRR
ncbi:MAG: MFS transporter [Phycisphaerales bacterium]|nr:MFS transporter [Phycisphaerales bacterium]